MNKIKIIVNPISGRGTGGKSVPIIKEILDGYGLDYDLVLTERPWHAADLAQEAAQDSFDCVVSASGDGTANEVLNGLMRVPKEKRPAMGILCVGRGNDFAFGAGIPAKLEDGCRILAEGYHQTMDVGKVTGGMYPDGRYFGNGVGIGFDAVVGFVAQKMTRLHGFVSYLVAALKTIFLYYQAPQVRIEYSGQTRDLRSLMVSIMNGTRMGGGFMMAPNGHNNDGVFDLCVASQISKVLILALIPRFMNGSQASHPAISTGQTDRILVTALEGVLPAHADGETLCTDGKQLELLILPQQIEMVCQRPEGAA